MSVIVIVFAYDGIVDPTVIWATDIKPATLDKVAQDYCGRSWKDLLDSGDISACIFDYKTMQAVKK